MTTIAPDEPTPLRIDLDGLADFATQLQHEVDANLQPYLVELIRSYNLGVTVGAGLPTPGMTRVRQHYQKCLASIIEQLNSFALAGSVLADAAHRIAARYRDADALAHASLTDVQDALTAASSAHPDPVTMPSTPDQPITINRRAPE
jgi:hypothetical protein